MLKMTSSNSWQNIKYDVLQYKFIILNFLMLYCVGESIYKNIYEYTVNMYEMSSVNK